MYEAYEEIGVERRGNVLWVTLNNPPLNAMTSEMHDELSHVFRLIDRDKETRAVVLTGSGDKGFSAGGNPKKMKDRIDDQQYWIRSMREAREIILNILECDKPIIGRINGHAVGLGASIALATDITIMVETAKIGDSHVKMGLVAADGGSLIWPHLVGLNTAKRYLFTGDLLSGSEAAEIGLVNFAVPASELDAMVDQWAERLGNGASLAIYGTKRALNSVIRQQGQVLMDMHLGLETLTHLSDDHRIAVDAFIEKQDPKFRGK